MTARTRRRPQFHPLRVARVDRLTDDAVAVTFDVPPELAEDYAFRPGQSLTLRRIDGGRDERRDYSICAPAGAAPRIGVREVPGGFFSSWLVHQVRPGDEIEVLPPSGTLHHRPVDAGRPRLRRRRVGHHAGAVAGGTVLRDGESTVTVLYGNRRTDTVMFADELADLKDRYGPRLQLVHVLSREPRDAELISGRLDGRAAAHPGRRASSTRRARRPLVAVRPARHGHRRPGAARRPGRAARSGCTRSCSTSTRCRRSRCAATRRPSSGRRSEVTVVLDGRATPLTLPRDVPVLDSAQKVRGDLPFACKGGVCGTCRARVTAGEVRMRRNYALEDEGGRGRLRAHLPVAAGHRRGDGRLRPVNRWISLAERLQPAHCRQSELRRPTISQADQHRGAPQARWGATSAAEETDRPGGRRGPGDRQHAEAAGAPRRDAAAPRVLRVPLRRRRPAAGHPPGQGKATFPGMWTNTVCGHPGAG